MQTRHRQIDFAEIDSGSFQSQEKEKTVKIPKKQTKRTLKKKEKNTAKDSIENVSEDKIHLLLELNSFNQNEKEGYSEKEKCLAVSCFLKVGGGFLLSVAKNASYYYSECIDNGITPVRHLQISRLRRKKEVGFSSFNPFTTTLVPMGTNDTDNSQQTGEGTKPSSIQSFMELPKQALIETPVNLDSIKLTNLPFPLTDQPTPITSYPFISVDETPPELSTFPFHKDANIETTIDNPKGKEGKHEIGWKAISPRDIVSYVAILLIELLKKGSSMECGFQSKDFLSRDRCCQIRNSIIFNDIDLPSDALIDSFLQGNETVQLQSENEIESIPEESVLNVFTEFMTERVPLLSIHSILQQVQIHLDHQIVTLFKSVRKSLRPTDSLLLLASILVIAESEVIFCHSIQGGFSGTFSEYCSLLIRGFYWFVTSPLSKVLLPEIHYLEFYKRSKSGQLRRQCFACSSNTSIHKRTRFVCSKCGKAFCNTEECFVMYHKKNSIPFYWNVYYVCFDKK